MNSDGVLVSGGTVGVLQIVCKGVLGDQKVGQVILEHISSIHMFISNTN